ncbi:hypothetical protein COV04_02640 [Candidatus Uhrbacteria bacterium CG10_big_fil_rev_8_21_14_0_10_48_11]|uniref:DUF8128 domain-containing protein n=1 Tax=Candidatus Uhrbacteria bacterium CG10_big_fil_rev_8_21_14_0_10_48_11 TaxID=1975037 RepID=A0A2M8LEE1_9BACT|nr:MAG: hypothetical protein COV04_02640 [Candidatus Uhrbacteria bacterium CG10_big_fil_rev_8_21_14_0_10_48_11]
MDVATPSRFAELLHAAIYGASPLIASWELFFYLVIHGGWIIFVIAFVRLGWFFWMRYIKREYQRQKCHWVLLAIDVPRDNVQSPKAVENIFAHLAGAHGTKTMLEKYWYGAVQESFSLEIVSIEGYVQFLIRTVDKFRDLVEAAVYSQYPDAQITEVEDYVEGYPTVYPDERYDMYGTEVVYVENEALPIRTYVEFEHIMSKEMKDPMNAVIETMGKLGPGEQLWLQIIILPITNSWKKEVIHKIKDTMGHAKETGSLLSSIAGEIQKFGQSASNQFGGGSGVLEEGHQEKGSLGGLLLLSPYDRDRIEAMSMKVKKIGYETKIRFVYIATKERFNVQHGREAFIGAIKQFNTENLNSLKPDTKHVGVHANYFFTDWRKNLKRRKLMHRYKEREFEFGREPYVMNIEELATLWHFPMMTETTPIRAAVQKTDFKHTSPPVTLPYASEIGTNYPSETKRQEGEVNPKPPADLPTA